MKTFEAKADTTGRVSVLERLARKIEPSDAELKAANKLPAYSRVARRIKPAVDIPEVQGKLTRDLLGHRGAPEGVAVIKTLDNKNMVFCTDGSWRHAVPRVKGKAARKAFKRAKRRG